MTEMLFKAAVDARRRGCPELADDIGKMLLSWTFKAGQYQTGWAILERSLYGLATLALKKRKGFVVSLPLKLIQIFELVSFQKKRDATQT